MYYSCCLCTPVVIELSDTAARVVVMEPRICQTTIVPTEHYNTYRRCQKLTHASPVKHDEKKRTVHFNENMRAKRI